MKTYVVYEIMSKAIRLRTYSENVANHNLNELNKKRGHLAFAKMDGDTYELNYGRCNGKK